MVGGPLGPSLAPMIKARMPRLARALMPVANWYANLAGYRKMGLKYDDLIMEESEDVQKAITRLSNRQQYDRAWRLRTAIQQSLLHQNLPKELWVTEQEDKRYLTQVITQVQTETLEREMWDSAVVEKSKKR